MSADTLQGNRHRLRYEIAAWTLAAVLLCGGLTCLASAHFLALGVTLRAAGVLVLLVWATFLRRKLTPWIVVGMVAGVELGLDAPAVAIGSHFLSDIFLRLVKTIVAPLILATLVSGIAGHGDLKSVGRMGWKSLLYFEVLTTIALVIGLIAANISKAGVGLAMPAEMIGSVPSAAPMHWQEFLAHVFPENIAKAIAEGQVLQVAVFAAIFGIALAMAPREKAAPVLKLAEGLSEVMFRFTNIVMYMAPLGVAAAMAYTVAKMGPGVLIHLGKLLLVFYGALLAFILFVLLPVALIARLPLRRLLRHVSGPAAIAFATATSEAALPRAMEEMEAFGVPRRILSFVIPAGYSFNLDGSTLYLAMAMVFVAQVANVPLSIGTQIFMMGTLMLASKGVAGVPRAVLVVLLATAGTLRLPSEPILILVGIDALMDMGRTAINVVGNCLASAVIARWEGALNTETVEPAVLAAMAE
ncbi:Na+/H+ dicarboxylate symporter [Terriglobus roseus DSM 18391]|uniref:Na+/H+ dicarboxylate symporter n=1 Tax=Terriglobus roseus (strain DSM 18391 / NRRL B-41598 / KBS 63) TaxID=926566 RepID=I3ZKA8_TERRK|nr:cation:dicarboxylase symporter family transporter [Terriglobus roseus]AFL89676.1 Na+/H+ dicarboxylate symporter [Terriglobus roseus DSM 18391]